MTCKSITRFSNEFLAKKLCLCYSRKKGIYLRLKASQESSMIPSGRPTVQCSSEYYFHWKVCYVLLHFKSVTDGLTEETCENNDHCRLDYEKDEWINTSLTRQASSMIHSARITVSKVANIVFASNLFCFEVRTDDMWKNNDHYRPWLWVGREDQ